MEAKCLTPYLSSAGDSVSVLIRDAYCMEFLCFPHVCMHSPLPTKEKLFSGKKRKIVVGTDCKLLRDIK